MTPYQHVYETLTALGLPGTHMAYPVDEAPDPPFFVYRLDDDGSFRADGTDWTQMPRFEVQLLEAEPDRELEHSVAQAIRDEFSVPVSREEAWVEDEGCLVTYYTFTDTTDTDYLA